jgi:DNA-directed RNA polymerase subunit RPC12/RpoP
LAALVRLLLLFALVYGAVLIVVRIVRDVQSAGRRAPRDWEGARGGVDFDGGKDGAGPTIDITGQRDAFTGEPLDARRGLYRCGKCQATYHADTWQLLQREHGGACVACGARGIRPFPGTHR